MYQKNILAIILFILALVVIVFNIQIVVAYIELRTLPAVEINARGPTELVSDSGVPESVQLQYERELLRDFMPFIVGLTVSGLLLIVSSIGIWRNKKFAYTSAVVALVLLFVGQLLNLYDQREISWISTTGVLLSILWAGLLACTLWARNSIFRPRELNKTLQP